jgi:hypothetical protein
MLNGATKRITGGALALAASLVFVSGGLAQSVTPRTLNSIGTASTEPKYEPTVVNTEVERKGRTGRDVIFGTYLTLSKDCKVGATPKVEFPKPPVNGKVGTRTSAINLRAVPGAPRRNCIGTSPSGILVFFRPERRFKGEDSFTYKVTYPNGDTREVAAKAIVE